MTRDRLVLFVRIAVIAAVVGLALLSWLFLRGPAFWQRLYYPMPVEYRAAVAESSSRHDLNPYVVVAIIDAESAWRPQIVSKAGAVGLMQVLPATAQELSREGFVDERFDPDDLSDPAVNIEFGTAYIRYLVERYHEMETAIAAYNAGIGNVDEWVEPGGDIRETIEFPETRHYVLRVMRARDVYERLYPDVFSNGASR
ncbi:MAG: lytic transglycosylase domain-containing protein [Actinobacteria bacterium]|nr:lytic transglycosylase domain-containing protein [Actinomycetota bacterium]MCG2807252.1 lytic transglycosylase domain-containing protein [Coriobacteriia bacterium]